MIISGVAITVAAFFLWKQDLDKAFVVAALGLVAWFIHYRIQMKEIAAIADLERAIEAESDEEDEGESTV